MILKFFGHYHQIYLFTKEDCKYSCMITYCDSSHTLSFKVGYAIYAIGFQSYGLRGVSVSKIIIMFCFCLDLLVNTEIHEPHVRLFAMECIGSMKNSNLHTRTCYSRWITPSNKCIYYHDDVIQWNHFPRYWPFVRGIHRSPVNSPHKGQWRGALMFSLICARINCWVNTGEAGDVRRHRAHYDVIVMCWLIHGVTSVSQCPSGLFESCVRKLLHPVWMTLWSVIGFEYVFDFRCWQASQCPWW